MLWESIMTVKQLEAYFRRGNMVCAKIPEISRRLCKNFETLSASIDRYGNTVFHYNSSALWKILICFYFYFL